MLCSHFSKRRWGSVCHDVARYRLRQRQLLCSLRRAGCGGGAACGVDGGRLELLRVLHRWLRCNIANKPS